MSGDRGDDDMIDVAGMDEDTGLDENIGEKIKQQKQTSEEARQGEESSEGEPTATAENDAEAEAESADGQPDETQTAETEADETEDDGDDERINVKDRPHSKLMRQHDELHNRFDMVVTQVKLTWQQNGDDREIGPTRHIYPIILQEGLNHAPDLTAEEIAEYIDRINERDRNATPP